MCDIVEECGYEAATGIALVKVKRLGYRSALAVAAVVVIGTGGGDCAVSSWDSVIASPFVGVVVAYSGME
jgi:hypothetical protein